MDYYVFNYYDKFKCKNKDCKHTCCANWEIDIDKKTLLKYKALKEQNPKFENSIDFKNKSFILKNGRCPFLDQNNLCEIIKNHGEEYLCNICTLHPRFKNFFSFKEETGLGLTCEESAKIILSLKEKMSLVLVKSDKKKEKDTPFEKELLTKRKEIINIISDRKKIIDERVVNLLDYLKISKKIIDVNNFVQKLKTLEILNDAWKDVLNKKLILIKTEKNEFETCYEQLLNYFIYRHVSNSFDMTDLKARVIFSVLSYEFIKSHVNSFNLSFLDLIELSRAYSTEIEYSDDNLFSVLDYIEEKL